LCAMGYHGAQEHTPLGTNVEGTERSGEKDVGYQPRSGTTWSTRRSKLSSPARQGMMGTIEGRQANLSGKLAREVWGKVRGNGKKRGKLLSRYI